MQIIQRMSLISINIIQCNYYYICKHLSRGEKHIAVIARIKTLEEF